MRVPIAGLKAKAQAQAAGLAAIAEAAGGSVELAKFYLALDAGLFVELAKQTATAVQGLSPKLNIWNTGAAGIVPPRCSFFAVPTVAVMLRVAVLGNLLKGRFAIILCKDNTPPSLAWHLIATFQSRIAADIPFQSEGCMLT